MAKPLLSGTELYLLPRRGARSLGVALAAGLGFGAWMALADASVFADAVPKVQRMLAGSLSVSERIAMGARGGLVDELLLRGAVMSVLVWLTIQRTGRRGARAYWFAILATALVAYPLKDFAYFAGLEWSALTAARELTLHVAAGTLWGWLYWRHGWLAALTGHVGAHLALQPLLSLL